MVSFFGDLSDRKEEWLLGDKCVSGYCTISVCVFLLQYDERGLEEDFYVHP